MADAVAQPPHYTSHPSGVEMTAIAEHYGFCLGNVIKYVWRANLKGEPLEDLRKAAWYLDREIARREAADRALLPQVPEDLLGPFTTPGWTACGHSRSLRAGCPGCAARIDDEQFVRGEE